MATMTGLTPQQIAAMEPLVSTSKSYLRKINELKRQIGSDPTMDYDKNKRVHDKLDNFERKRNDVNKRINEIANARDIYQKKLDKCRNLLAEAEEMKQTYGF